MARLYGWGPKSERVVCYEPRGHWHTNTFVAALRHDGIKAPWLLEGAMNGDAFLSYVRRVLGPTLRKGDIVLLDNLSSHKVEGVREAVEARGATILYLPPYSPDFNPIENFFSKLKSLLRKAAPRSLKRLISSIRDILSSVSPAECLNYFISSGYVHA